MEKMSGESMNLLNENIEKLKALFPEIVTDGKIDFDMLKTLLGEEVDASNEKYSFNWVGKRNCIKFAQTPSTGTLIPCKEKSVDFDNTQNIYIEGDNVEALKLLQKTYFGKIKMIYIDPPYNTGNDFVYHDDYKDSIENYKKITGQQATANPETNGRFHTDWLNMMYPRLKLAKDLLSDDGVIFISIDDHEVDNLKKVCEEIFGESNYVANLVWQKKTGAADAVNIATITENIIVYAKELHSIEFRKNTEAHDDNRYKYKDEYFAERGPFYYDNLDRGTLGYHETLDYGIETPDGTLAFPNGRTKQFNDGWRWKWGKEKMAWGIKNGFIELQKAPNKPCGWGVYYKIYLNVDNEGKIIERSSPYKNIIQNILNTHAANEAKKIMGSAMLFSNPKPMELLKFIVSLVNDKKATIMDFFSGSATTAHAVMQLNAEDGGNRKFIMVQLPELCDEKSEAYKAGYKTICDIGEERIRRAGAKIKEENPLTTLNLDTGFKVFRLDSTNIVPWNNAEKLDEMRLYDYAKTIKDGRDDLSVAYEIMLKYGVFDKPMKETVVSGKKMYDVGEGYMIICLADGVTMTDVEAIARLNPHCVVFKESGFADDNEKINATHTLERGGVEKILCI